LFAVPLPSLAAATMPLVISLAECECDDAAAPTSAAVRASEPPVAWLVLWADGANVLGVPVSDE
jgi:hypothetical protein